MMSRSGGMMSRSGGMMSVEDLEDLVEDGFSLTTYMSDSEKRARKRSSSSKPPQSPRSPYLSSMKVNPMRGGASAWRPMRAILGGEGGARTPARPARDTWLNGQDVSQTDDVTSEHLTQALSIRPKHSRSTSNGAPCYREKEDMYEEILQLKKSLQAQRSDNDKMKAKLRRLEEDKTKRERQIEELLDPTKGAEYTRSLLHKNTEGSEVVNGLKQRILKLEQQCREKGNALTKLQSDLRTTSLEELKITVETYYEEVGRLRGQLEMAERSGREERRGSHRQNKVLTSTVLRLSENLKQLQQENLSLKEELSTDSPAGGARGYREWSKQRLVRRLMELEQRLEERRKPAHSGKISRLDQAVQTDLQDTPPDAQIASQDVTVAAEEEVATGTAPRDREGLIHRRGFVTQLEKEELEERLTNKELVVERLRAEREEVRRETERWKNQLRSEREEERWQYRQEMERLFEKVQVLEERLEKESSRGGPKQEPQNQNLTENLAEEPEEEPRGEEGGGEREEETEEQEGGKEQREEDRKKEKEEDGGKDEKEEEEREEGEKEGREEEREDGREEERKEEREDGEKEGGEEEREWLEHTERDTVLLQSAMRAHLLRHAQLQHLRNTHDKSGQSECSADVISSAEEDMDVAMTLIQSVFRGHLARTGLPHPIPTPTPRRNLPTHTPRSTEGKQRERDPWPVSNTLSSRKTVTPAQLELHPPPDSEVAKAMDSDDSDDIIVSPTRPLRRRETLLA